MTCVYGQRYNLYRGRECGKAPPAGKESAKWIR
nr:MAG TPA: hypothetical protein [Caudoviricetes sp.]